MLDNQVALNSITQAWAVLLQITVTNNWQDIARFRAFPTISTRCCFET